MSQWITHYLSDGRDKEWPLLFIIYYSNYFKISISEINIVKADYYGAPAVRGRLFEVRAREYVAQTLAATGIPPYQS